MDARVKFLVMPQLSAQVTTPQLSDALDAGGRRSQVMHGAISPLTIGARAVGRAVTVQFAAVDQDVENPYDAAIDFIDSIEPGSIVVIASEASQRTAFWGELFSAAAIGRGAVGVVCDSYVRDSGKVRALGFPTFAIGTRPIDFRARMEITASHRPVVCGGVLVNPGDLVLADDDGVVVVPADLEADTVMRANEKAEKETVVLDELLAGATLKSVWARYGVL
jgi:4-hydroxy-4-methyl-2-oxoglutarate aldolase